MECHPIKRNSEMSRAKKAEELKKILRLRMMPGLPTVEKNAGVLILLDHFDDEYQVLLCVRSENLRTHPGEVCFPGGMFDDDDKNLQQTAIREAEEEVGVSTDDYFILGCLPPFRSRFGVIIQPTVAFVKRQLRLTLNIHEVSRYFWKPLSAFLADDEHNSYHLDARYTVHSFNFTEAHTYGVTALLCVVIAMGVLQRHPSFDLTPQITEAVMLTIPPNAAIDAVYFSASLPFKTTSDSKL